MVSRLKSHVYLLRNKHKYTLPSRGILILVIKWQYVFRVVRDKLPPLCKLEDDDINCRCFVICISATSKVCH